MLNIILGIILLVLVLIYMALPTKEHFDINAVQPDNSVFKDDNQISSYEKYDLVHGNQCDDECKRIDNYRHKFFAFNDRINHSSHLVDMVDNMNITNNTLDCSVGTPIACVYDKMVNSYDYKHQS